MNIHLLDQKEDLQPFRRIAYLFAMDKQKKQIQGLLFIGPMFAGMGLGFIFGNIPAGLFTGMGIGFAFQALYLIADRDKRLAREQMREDIYENEEDTLPPLPSEQEWRPSFDRDDDPFERGNDRQRE